MHAFKAVFLLAILCGAYAVQSQAQNLPKPNLKSTPIADSKLKKPIENSNIENIDSKQLREAIRSHELQYSNYMEILKTHRDKVADWKVVRRQSNARVKTTLRSQNTDWNGYYDCNDDDPAIKPNQVEVCDGIDNDCDGDIDEEVTANLFLDADGDGWGDPRQPYKACHVESGYAARANDCDDKNIQIYPGAADPEGDGIDSNCDGKDG